MLGLLLSEMVLKVLTFYKIETRKQITGSLRQHLGATEMHIFTWKTAWLMTQ